MKMTEVVVHNVMFFFVSLNQSLQGLLKKLTDTNNRDWWMGATTRSDQKRLLSSMGWVVPASVNDAGQTHQAQFMLEVLLIHLRVLDLLLLRWKPSLSIVANPYLQAGVSPEVVNLSPKYTKVFQT